MDSARQERESEGPVRLPDGLVAVVKGACPTCELIAPVLGAIEASGVPLTVLSQDDPAFPATVTGVVDDTALDQSYRLGIEIVPTVIRVVNGTEVERIIGWNRPEWRAFSGLDSLGADLPENRPGCGALNVEPGITEELAVRFGSNSLAAGRVVLAPSDDEAEVCFDRGWTDGLPVVPPTEARVMKMLDGTRRAPDEVVGVVAPDYAPSTVEKAAINAVMAGCKPEYMPVVLAALEAACLDGFCLHGVVATTDFPGPVVVVNGPVAKRIGMNAGHNALGQGNRANAAIGRALQLIVRNVGGGRPGGVDQSCLGNPGKFTFCFAEDEENSAWEPLSVERGFAPGASTVTLFAGCGMQPVYDNHSRKPESLARTYAACLRGVLHPKLARADAMMVIAPEHGRAFESAGWSKAELYRRLGELLSIPIAEMRPGYGGMEEGVSADVGGETVAKFRPGGLLLVRAGGTAGFFAGIIAGWSASGPTGSEPVTVEIKQ